MSCSARELFEWLIYDWPLTALAASTTRSLTSKPTLPELLKFRTSSGRTVNIVEQIGTHYSTLGPLLLTDDTGAVISAIADKHQRSSETINQEILTRWLQGLGKLPVTWSTLLDVLRDVGLSELTQMIRNNLSISEASLPQTSSETVTYSKCIHYSRPSVAAVQSPVTTQLLPRGSGRLVNCWSTVFFL